MRADDIANQDLHLYTRSARHHHRNSSLDDLPETVFKLRFLVQPEKFGVRLRVKDELPRGTVEVDVALIYQWSRPATTSDDLDGFALDVGIPQVLDCASAFMVDAARSAAITVPFYGSSAKSTVIDNFRQRKVPLASLLDRQALMDDDDSE